MKISKKVVIKRNPEQVWSCLTNIRSKTAKIPKTEKTCFRKSAIIKFKGHTDEWQVIDLKKTQNLKLHRRKKGPNVNIDIKLTPLKTRTELKLTLSGWENADSETKKSDIPKVSLNWEKTLIKLKKVAESE